MDPVSSEPKPKQVNSATYLARGTRSISKEVNWKEPEALASRDKHSLSSDKTWFMSGLPIEVRLTQDIAVSTAFHADAVLNRPWSLWSTMLYRSPCSMRGVIHWMMWVLLFRLLNMASRQVMTSSSMIPKLYRSLFQLRLPDNWNLKVGKLDLFSTTVESRRQRY